ncbi:MAG: hypothetical protein O2782_02840 [bacterium]|nr:hypothetical protein [bacterium]
MLAVLLAGTETTTQRLKILGQLGAFRFLTTEPAESRKLKLIAAVRDATEAELPAQAAALADIWRPEPRSFLDMLIHRPTEAARLLARRPVPGIVDHPLSGIGEEGRQAFIKSGVISWRETGVVHLVAGVGNFLQTCAGGDSRATPSGLTPLQLLLLHDEVTDALRQSSTMEAAARHIVARTLIGCLSRVDLALTVESFFVAWESHQSIAAAAQQRVRTEPVGVDATVGLSTDNSVDDEQWMDCIITHEDLRPEAFAQCTLAEQHRILREMFAEDWSEEDELALETVAVAPVSRHCAGEHGGPLLRRRE